MLVYRGLSALSSIPNTARLTTFSEHRTFFTSVSARPPGKVVGFSCGGKVGERVRQDVLGLGYALMVVAGLSIDVVDGLHTGESHWHERTGSAVKCRSRVIGYTLARSGYFPGRVRVRVTSVMLHRERGYSAISRYLMNGAS
ncbi:hypothetical protein J6590_016077 [Homalodisca vitripennis]|nr:hypothetical protein J6590_016077 [Homalodisca vitripennis]